MDKDGLLKSIATTGYNVGFGAKKHFATFDIVEKAPGWIGFISTAVGIASLVIDTLGSKGAAAALAVLGSCTVYINGYRGKDYDAGGRKLTQIYNQLRDLYYEVQAGADVNASHANLKTLEGAYYETAISKQILFSDWFAHYKFFAQQERAWINEQRRFTWRDMVPLSFRIAFPLFIVLCLFMSYLIWRLSDLESSAVHSHTRHGQHVSVDLGPGRRGGYLKASADLRLVGRDLVSVQIF